MAETTKDLSGIAGKYSKIGDTWHRFDSFSHETGLDGTFNCEMWNTTNLNVVSKRKPSTRGESTGKQVTNYNQEYYPEDGEKNGQWYVLSGIV